MISKGMLIYWRGVFAALFQCIDCCLLEFSSFGNFQSLWLNALEIAMETENVFQDHAIVLLAFLAPIVQEVYKLNSFLNKFK